MTKETKETVLTSFRTAIDWLKPSLILCNNITEIDEELLFEGANFQTYDEETEEYLEFYQYFLTSFTADDVEWMEKHFDKMYFAYSNKLDLWVLCVSHYGTSWDYVSCEVLDDDFKEIIKRNKLTYKDLTGYEY